VSEQFSHHPVLLAEVLIHLNLKSDGVYVDATFGRGGHSRAILERLGPNARLFAFDRDPDAWAHIPRDIASDERFTMVHRSFSEFFQRLDRNNNPNKLPLQKTSSYETRSSEKSSKIAECTRST